MSLEAWRIVKRKHARHALTGEGARRYGGRWNSPGTPMVYTAATQSLAVLEMLVHLDAAELLSFYVAISLQFEDSLLEVMEPADLPRTWRADPPPARLAAIGDAWAAEQRSVVLAVPSAVIPHERNYLLNPLHPKFSEVAVGPTTPFRFDARLGPTRDAPTSP